MARSSFGRRVGIMATASVLAVPVLSSSAFAAGGVNRDCGAYCSTGTGTASGNGGGADPAGKPCAGCVGRADNTNPKGQSPGGSDHNNGYECDGNHGIAQGNPAHTTCTPVTVPVVSTPTPTPTPTPTDGTNDTGTVSGPVSSPSGTPVVTGVNGGATVAAGQPQVPSAPSAPSAPAGAPVHKVATSGRSGVRTPDATGSAAAPTAVLGERVTRSPASPVSPAPAAAGAPAAVAATATSLPFTGAPTALLVLIAVLALATGVGFVRLGSRGASAA